jgi:hypothetical protein
MHQPYRKAIVNRLLLVIVLLSLAACFQGPEPQTDGAQRRTFVFDQPQTLGNQSIVSDSGITLTFEKTADWDAGNGVRGFTANLIILNQTGEALDD